MEYEIVNHLAINECSNRQDSYLIKVILTRGQNNKQICKIGWSSPSMAKSPRGENNGNIEYSNYS